MKYEDLTIENIWSQFGLAPALKEGKVDAVVSWEPYVTQVLTQVPDSYEVIRGGQHMSYVMVATAHGPTVESKPAADQKRSPRASRSPRTSRATTATRRWRFSPSGCRAPTLPSARRRSSTSASIRGMSPNVLRAFENAEDEVLINTLKGAPRLDVPSLFRPEFMARSRRSTRNISRICRSWLNSSLEGGGMKSFRRPAAVDAPARCRSSARRRR